MNLLRLEQAVWNIQRAEDAVQVALNIGKPHCEYPVEHFQKWLDTAVSAVENAQNFLHLALHENPSSST